MEEYRGEEIKYENSGCAKVEIENTIKRKRTIYKSRNDFEGEDWERKYICAKAIQDITQTIIHSALGLSGTNVHSTRFESSASAVS